VTRGRVTARPAAVAVLVLGVSAVAAVLTVLGGDSLPRRAGTAAIPLEGRDEREPVVLLPTIEASFAAEGYRAGATARLVFFDRAHDVRLRLYRVGSAVGRLPPATMRGVHVGGTRRLASVRPGQSVAIRLDPGWESGVWFAELTAPGGRVGYAPFVLAPRWLGGRRTAIVVPTQTWQAYNFRDDDGDGHPNTWYAADAVDGTARLDRPFENRGVPPNYRTYDDPFLRWIDGAGDPVDYLSDRDLRRTTPAALARAYDLLIFEGHHEYVTGHELDVVTGFRDRGGNLMFLSANTFFWQITLDDGVMKRMRRWRAIGRDEASLVGVHYWGWDSAHQGGGPWIVRDTPASSWIFAGTGLGPGSAFSHGGIEADRTGARSPASVEVVAEIRNAFGKGRPAQMTYYRAPSGAEVFAAGAFSLAAAIWQPPVSTMVANLIERLSGVRPSPVLPGAEGASSGSYGRASAASGQ
jgi:hypothetical protein